MMKHYQTQKFVVLLGAVGAVGVVLLLAIALQRFYTGG
jgi:hypothetical protein